MSATSVTETDDLKVVKLKLEFRELDAAEEDLKKKLAAVREQKQKIWLHILQPAPSKAVVA